MMNRLFLAAVGILLATHPQPARAQGYSFDVELLRPTFSLDSSPGLDSARLEAGVTRMGMLLQYERDPLILYEEGEEVGAVISNRQATWLGLVHDIDRRFSLRAVLPLYAQWGGDINYLGYDGVGTGDPSVGGRLVMLDSTAVSVGLQADLRFPAGTQAAFMGETGVRPSAGLLGSLGSKAYELLLDLSVTARSTTVLEEDLVIGPEMDLGVGLRHWVWPERVSLVATMLHRASLASLSARGGENATELLFGCRFPAGDRAGIDLGVGKGLTYGYGTSQFRVLVSMNFMIREPSALRQQYLVLMNMDSLQRPTRQDEHEAVVVHAPWQDGELARLQEEWIQVRKPIQFQVDTSRILPESRPTLLAVAELLNQNPRIDQILVEGHASEEGDYDYNYALSTSRARAIYDALIQAGVHPARLSYRGMGEISPVAQGMDEQSLAMNRRVVFQILHQLDPLEPLPRYEPVQLPWSGKAVQPESQPEPTDPADPPDSGHGAPEGK